MSHRPPGHSVGVKSILVINYCMFSLNKKILVDIRLLFLFYKIQTQNFFHFFLYISFYVKKLIPIKQQKVFKDCAISLADKFGTV